MPRKIKEIAWAGDMPKCDICDMLGYNPVRAGIYDAPTTQGPWANLCTQHLREYTRPDCQLVTKRVKSAG